MAAQRIKSLYVTDYGYVRLRDGQLVETAEMWRRYADDLVGMPEIDPADNAMTEMQILARKQWRKRYGGNA